MVFSRLEMFPGSYIFMGFGNTFTNEFVWKDWHAYENVRIGFKTINKYAWV